MISIILIKIKMSISLSESIVLKQLIFAQPSIYSIRNICVVCGKEIGSLGGRGVKNDEMYTFLCMQCYCKCQFEMENYRMQNAKKIVAIKYLLCDDIAILIYKNIIDKSIDFFKKRNHASKILI